MNWLALARVIIEMLGPWLQRWLDDLLTRAADELTAEGYRPSVTADWFDLLFDRARGKTWAWQVTRRGLLAAAHKTVSARRNEVVAACLGTGSQPYLTRNEDRELASLV